MREIKFRAWDTKKKRFDYEPLIARGECCYIDSFDNFEIYEEGRMVLQQYTGLKDKNGKDIFEGDIVKGKVYLNNIELFTRFIGEVNFNAPKFELDGINKYKGCREELNRSFEVIGNVYDNADLLKG